MSATLVTLEAKNVPLNPPQEWGFQAKNYPLNRKLLFWTHQAPGKAPITNLGIGYVTQIPLSHPNHSSQKFQPP